MDPLSIGSAVVGLIAAATRVGPILQHFIMHTRDAPKSASQVLDEMQSTTAALEQLQVYLIGVSKTNAARRAMLSLRSIVTSLTACVTTYSDLERVVNNCVNNGQVYRVKWIYYEDEIVELVQKVRGHKLSLVLMLSILQCESQREAETSMDGLNQLVERVISSNEDIKRRIDAMSMGPAPVAPTALDITSTSFSRKSSMKSPFEEDLDNSRVYKKVRPQKSIWSISSSQRASMALSTFSDLTFAEVSVISVFCLPVWSADLSNPADYRFGREGLRATMSDSSERYPEIAFPDIDLIDDEVNSVPGNRTEETSESELKFEALFLAAASVEWFNIASARKNDIWRDPMVVRISRRGFLHRRSVSKASSGGSGRSTSLGK